jgi:hypothetical protein
MATVMLMHWKGVTPEQYEEARRRVRWEEEPADGGILHVSGFDDDGLNVVDVWESPEHFQRFAETRLRPVTDELIDGEPDVRFYPLHAAWSPRAELAVT